MGKGRKVLSSDHARALIKQAIGIIFGEITVETEATAEIAAIEAQHLTVADVAHRAADLVGPHRALA